MFGASRPGGEITSTAAARDYLDSILIETRFLDSDLPRLKTSLFGEEFVSPIAAGALSHLPSYGEGRPLGLVEIARVAGERGMANFLGITDDSLFSEIAGMARTVRIVKPFADRTLTTNALAAAEKNGALAVGVDIDMVYDKGGSGSPECGFPLWSRACSVSGTLSPPPRPARRGSSSALTADTRPAPYLPCWPCPGSAPRWGKTPA